MQSVEIIVCLMNFSMADCISEKTLSITAVRNCPEIYVVITKENHNAYI